MIIRLEKEQKIKDMIEGKWWYHITIDGVHLDNSFTLNYDSAFQMFEKLCQSQGNTSISEVIAVYDTEKLEAPKVDILVDNITSKF